MSNTLPEFFVRENVNGSERALVKDREGNRAAYLNVIPLYVNKKYNKINKNENMMKEKAQITAVLVDQTHLLVSTENMESAKENEFCDQNDNCEADLSGVFIINLCQNKRIFDIIKEPDYTSESKYRYNNDDNDSSGDEKCDWNNLQEIKLSKVNEQHWRKRFSSPFCFNGIVRDYTKQTVYNLINSAAEHTVNNKYEPSFVIQNKEGKEVSKQTLVPQEECEQILSSCEHATSNARKYYYNNNSNSGGAIDTSTNSVMCENSLQIEREHGSLNDNAKFEQYNKDTTTTTAAAIDLFIEKNSDCVIDSNRESGSFANMQYAARKELEDSHFTHEETITEKSECENDMDDLTHTECPVFDKRQCVVCNDCNVNTSAGKSIKDNQCNNFGKRNEHDDESSSFSESSSESSSLSDTEKYKSDKIHTNASKLARLEKRVNMKNQICENCRYCEETNEEMSMEQAQDSVEHHFIVSNSVSHSIWAVVINVESLSFRINSYDCFFSKRFSETKSNKGKVQTNNVSCTNVNASSKTNEHESTKQSMIKADISDNTTTNIDNKLSSNMYCNNSEVCKGEQDSDNAWLDNLTTEINECSNNEISPIIGSADGVAGFVDGHFTVARFNKPTSLCWRLPGEYAHTQEHWSENKKLARSSTSHASSSSFSRCCSNNKGITPTQTRNTENDEPEHLAQEAINTNVNSLINANYCEVLFISDTGNHAIRYANFRSKLVRTIVGITSTSPKIGYRDGSCLSSLLISAVNMTWIEVAYHQQILEASTITSNEETNLDVSEDKNNREVWKSEKHVNKSHGAIVFIDKENHALRMISPITLDAFSSPSAQRSRNKITNSSKGAVASAIKTTSITSTTNFIAKQDKGVSNVQPIVTTILESELQKEHQISAGKDIHNRETNDKINADEKSKVLNLSSIALVNRSNLFVENIQEETSNLFLLANESRVNKLFYLDNHKHVKSNSDKSMMTSCKEEKTTKSNTTSTKECASHNVAPMKDHLYYHEIKLRHAYSDNEHSKNQCYENFSPSVLLPCTVFSENKCIIAHAIIAVDVNKNVMLLYNNDAKKEYERQTENCAFAQSTLTTESEAFCCEIKSDKIERNVEVDSVAQNSPVNIPQCERKNLYAILESGLDTLLGTEFAHEYFYRFTHPHVLPPLPSTYLMWDDELPLSHQHKHTKHTAETCTTKIIIAPELHDQRTPNELNSLLTENKSIDSMSKTNLIVTDNSEKKDSKETNTTRTVKVNNELLQQEPVTMASNTVNEQLYPYSFPFAYNNINNVNSDNANDSCHRFVRHNISASSEYNLNQDNLNSDYSKCDVPVKIEKSSRNNSTALSGHRTRSKPITLMAPSAKTPTPERIKYKSTPNNAKSKNKTEQCFVPCAYNETIAQEANPSVESHTNKKLFSDKCETAESIAKMHKSDKEAEKEKNNEPFQELQLIEQTKSNKPSRKSASSESYAELFDRTRSHSRSEQADQKRAAFINVSVTDKSNLDKGVTNAFTENTENAINSNNSNSNRIITTTTHQDNATLVTRQELNENNHHHDEAENSSSNKRNKELLKAKKRSCSSSSSSPHKRLTSRSMSVHEAIHKRRNTTHCSALRARSAQMCNTVHTTKENESDVHMSTNVSDGNTSKCAPNNNKKLICNVCVTPEQEDTPTLQEQLLNVGSINSESKKAKLVERQIKNDEVKLVLPLPPQQKVSLHAPLSQLTVASSLLNDKKHSCTTCNMHSGKRPAIALPAQSEQGVRLSISSKELKDDIVVNAKINHADMCRNNNKHTDAHTIINNNNNNNCWYNDKSMEISSTSSYSNRENERMSSHSALCDSERRKELNVIFNARSEWYSSSVSLLFEVYRRFAKRRREVKVILENESNHSIREEHKLPINETKLQWNTNMTREQSAHATPSKMEENYNIIGKTGSQCRSKEICEDVEHTYTEVQENHFTNVSNIPQLSQATEVNMGKYLLSNDAHTTDMNNSKINKVIRDKNIISNINYKNDNIGIKKASRVKDSKMINRDTNDRQNSYIMPSTSMPTPQVQQIVTYEMNIISLWRFILSSNCLFNILAMMKECLCDNVKYSCDDNNNHCSDNNKKNTIGTSELCELHNRFTLTTEGMLLSLPTWDVRVLCEWLYLCGVRKHGYHTLVKMDFTNFRRLVLLLGLWNTQVQRYHHCHEHVDVYECNNVDHDKINNSNKNNESKHSSIHSTKVLDANPSKTKECNKSYANLNTMYKSFACIDHVPALDAVEDATCVYMYRNAARRINNKDILARSTPTKTLNEGGDEGGVEELMLVLSQNEQIFNELFDCFSREVHISRSSNYTPPTSVETHLSASMINNDENNDDNKNTKANTKSHKEDLSFTKLNKSAEQSHFALPYPNNTHEQLQSSLPHHINISSNKELTLTPWRTMWTSSSSSSSARESNHKEKLQNLKRRYSNKKAEELQQELKEEQEEIVPHVESCSMPNNYYGVIETTVEYNPCDLLWKLKHLYSTTVSESLHISQNRTWGIEVMSFASFMKLWKIFDVCPTLISFRVLEEIYLTSLLEPLIQNAQTQPVGSANKEENDYSKVNLLLSNTLQTNYNEEEKENYKTKRMSHYPKNNRKTNNDNDISIIHANSKSDSIEHIQEKHKKEMYAQLRCLRQSTALTSLMFVESFVRVAIWCFSTCGAADALRFPTIAEKVHGLMTWMNKQIALGYVAERLHEHRKTFTVNVANRVNKVEPHPHMSKAQNKTDSLANVQKGKSMYMNRDASALLARSRNVNKTNHDSTSIFTRGGKTKELDKRRGKCSDSVYDANSVDRQSSLLSLKPFKIEAIARK